MSRRPGWAKQGWRRGGRLTCHEQPQLQGPDVHAPQARWHVLIVDALRQPLHQSRLAHACRGGGDVPPLLLLPASSRPHPGAIADCSAAVYKGGSGAAAPSLLPRLSPSNRQPTHAPPNPTCLPPAGSWGCAYPPEGGGALIHPVPPLHPPTWLPQDDGVVLAAPAEDANHAAQLLAAPNHRVQLPLSCRGCEVVRVVGEVGCSGPGGGGSAC